MHCKRRKLDSSSSSQIETNRYDEQEALDNWHLRPVLDDDVIADKILLLDVFVDTVADPRHTSRLIQELNALCPIPTIQHLKRVSKSEVILNLASEEDTPEMCVQKLKDRGLDTAGLSCEPKRLQVPAVAPKTRRQYQEAVKLWPCNFHENKYLGKVLSDKLFDVTDKLEQQMYMKKCLEAAQCSFEAGGAGVGALMVDPAKKQVIAVGYDDRGKYHLKHAVMVVVDLVAHSQGGGAWKVGDRQSFLETEKSFKRKTHKQDVVSASVAMKPIKRYSSSEAVGKQTLSNAGLGCRDLERSDVGGFEEVQAKDGCDSSGVTSADREPKTGPYICTGYDVYVTREPCAMCAMALVHSRVRRVFYGCPSPQGALGTQVKLHTLKGLNHHYEVFAGILEKDCESIQTTFPKNFIHRSGVSGYCGVSESN
jgi:tRNA-specific adenosine deaminase 3